MPAHAGLFLPPQGVIEAAIISAEQDKLTLFLRCCDLTRIASDPQHPMNPEETVAFLKNIDNKQVAFESKEQEYPYKTQTVVVLMSKPTKVEFILFGKEEINGVFFRIVGIHPK